MKIQEVQLSFQPEQWAWVPAGARPLAARFEAFKLSLAFLVDEGEPIQARLVLVLCGEANGTPADMAAACQYVGPVVGSALGNYHIFVEDPARPVPEGLFERPSCAPPTATEGR